MVLPQSDSDLARLDLNPGDVLALDASTPMVEQLADDVCTLWFEPVAADDDRAVWVDPFFGTRGSSATSVIEWSKGTIHHATEQDSSLIARDHP